MITMTTTAALAVLHENTDWTTTGYLAGRLGVSTAEARRLAEKLVSQGAARKTTATGRALYRPAVGRSS